MAEVINDILGYDGLKVIQDSEKFNFSLDSTLLANFTNLSSKDKEILDIGCGNAFIPLFLSIKTKNHITGIEIQEELADLSRRSVELNHLEKQITIVNQDVRTYYKVVGVSQFDVIVSNPPYFKVEEHSNFNKNDYLTNARHETTLTLDELLDSVRKLLKDNGKFYLVHRAERMVDVIEAFRKYGIELKRLQFIYPKKSSKDAYLILIEGLKSKRLGGLKIEKPLYIHKENGEYRTEILKIFRFKGDNNEKANEFQKQ